MDIGKIKKACTETLVLSLLRDGPLHGYDMARRIERRTAGYFTFKHGTLYPVLHRLEKAGLIKGRWTSPAEGERPRKDYELTAAGRAYRQEGVASWREFFQVMTSLIPELG